MESQQLPPPLPTTTTRKKKKHLSRHPQLLTMFRTSDTYDTYDNLELKSIRQNNRCFLFSHFQDIKKCYELNELQTQALKQKLNEPIPNICKDISEFKTPDQKLLINACSKCKENITYQDIINLINHRSGGKPHTVYLYGGSVRDYVNSNLLDIRTLNDIDINFTLTPTHMFTETLRKTDTNLSDVYDKFKFPGECLNKKIEEYSPKQISSMQSRRRDKIYIKIGRHRTNFLELLHINNSSYRNIDLECRCNSLSIILDYTVNRRGDENTRLNYILIDLFNGEGINDAKNKIYCAPFIDIDKTLNKDHQFTDNNLQNWVESKKNTKLLWRMLKFLNRGYTIEPRTAVTIYNYWYHKGISNDTETELRWDKYTVVVKNLEDLELVEGMIIKHFNELNDSLLKMTSEQLIELIRNKTEQSTVLSVSMSQEQEDPETVEILKLLKILKQISVLLLLNKNRSSRRKKKTCLLF